MCTIIKRMSMSITPKSSWGSSVFLSTFPCLRPVLNPGNNWLHFYKILENAMTYCDRNHSLLILITDTRERNCKSISVSLPFLGYQWQHIVGTLCIISYQGYLLKFWESSGGLLLLYNENKWLATCPYSSSDVVWFQQTRFRSICRLGFLKIVVLFLNWVFYIFPFNKCLIVLRKGTFLPT